jgi:hypothetical protein
MHRGVARRTKRDQVLLAIIPGMTAKLFVMNFKVRHGTARLASPTIAAEDLISELFVRLGIKSQGNAFWSNRVHDAVVAK